MSLKHPLWVLLGALIFTTGLHSAEEMTDSDTGKTFPKTITFQHQGEQFNLSGTGVSTRKKFFVKVYSIASYIEDPSSVKEGDIFNNILNSKQAKQLTSIWLRNVGQNKVQDGYRDSLKKVTSGNSSEIDKFISFFGDVNNGDTHIIRWLPDGTITVTINGEEKGSIKNEQFAKALWSVWFGKDSVVNRNKLISLIQ